MDFTNNTNPIFQRTIITPINNHLKYLIHDNYCLYLNRKTMVIQKFHMRKKNDSLSNYISFISVPTRILVLGDLAFFATIVGENNMSGYWCH